MKLKITLLLLACMVFSLSNAQTEKQLKKHVSYLASKELKGRKAQSPEAEKTLKYIKSDLENAGLKCKDFYLPADSLNVNVNIEDPNKEYSGKYHALYTVIESSKANKSDEYIVITAEYTGYGVDTIQGYEIINYSAHHTAASTAMAMELAKQLNKERAELDRGVIIIFPDDGYTRPYANYLMNDYKNIVMGFDMYNLGFQPKDSLGNYYEEEYNIDYALSPRLKRATQIITPLTMNDLDIHSNIHEDYSGENSKIPFSYISNDNYVTRHEDIADTLDYVMMDKLTAQIQKVIIGFSNTKLDIDSYKEKLAKQEEDFEIEFSRWGRKYKNRSYFGINLMPLGSNQHDYEEGNMTGKPAYAFSAGLFYRWEFSSAWALKLDANYEHVNAKRHDGKYHADVISIPLSIMLTTGGRSVFEFDVYFGAYYDYILGGKLAGKKLDFDDFKHDEWGFQCGFDFRIDRFIIGGYYKTPWNSVNTEEYRQTNGIGRINEGTAYFKLGLRL